MSISQGRLGCAAFHFPGEKCFRKAPVAHGIGQGTYRGLRLTIDISDEVRRHSSQFLGTGVIRAQRAEFCGLKGLRIFILIQRSSKTGREIYGQCRLIWPKGFSTLDSACPALARLRARLLCGRKRRSAGRPRTARSAHQWHPGFSCS